MDKRTRAYKEWKAEQETLKEREMVKELAKEVSPGQGRPVETAGPPVGEKATPLPDLPPLRGKEEVPVVLLQPPSQTTSTAAATVELKPAPAERRPATKPWEKKNGARPWRRDYFNLQRRRPGFRCRFVDPEKVESRVQRGYAIANPDDYGGLVDTDIKEGSPMGRLISRHGMILMEIPEEGARAYEQQQEEFIQSQYKNIRERLKKDAAEVGMEVSIKEVGLR